MLLRHNYKQAAWDYKSDCTLYWKNCINQQWANYKKDSNTENITIDENLIQTALNKMASSYDYNAAQPYSDRAAMLIDVENLTYYVSQPEVRFRIYDARNPEAPNAKRTRRFLTADPELSEQIKAELRDSAGKNYTKYTLLYYCDYFIPDPSFMDTPSHPVLDALHTFLSSRICDDPVPIAVYLADEKICGVEYGYAAYQYKSDESPIPVIFRQGTVQQEGVQEYRNSAVSLRDGQYVYLYQNDENTPDEAYLGYWMLYGSLQSTEAGSAIAMTAQKMDEMRVLDLDKRNKYQKIIDDESGKLLNEYYKAEAKQISDYYKMFRNDTDDMSEYNDAMKSIVSPKIVLEDLYNSFAYRPFKFAEGSGFTNYDQNFHYCGSEKLQINGRTWYLFHCDHEDWWMMNRPFFILYGIAGVIGSLLAALIWATIAHIRFRHKFEMDEYRRNLTASLAHDLKSPLMAISSYSENLLNDVQPEKRKHYEKAILENTQYMDNIIVNVLELSKLEMREKTKRTMTDLTALAEELLGGMQDQLNARSLKASVLGSCTVKADREMMKQALRNLLDNAVKYTPEGGSITVTGQKHTLRIVNDIAEEQIADPQRLSEAFVKGDEARSNRMGTGLGLSIVQQIAAQNKLRLHMESSAHQFRVKLRQRTRIRMPHRHQAKRKTINLTPLAEELLAGMQEQLESQGLKTAVSGRCIVNADAQMMTQAIRDLLNNAVRYMPESGSLTVTGQKHTLSIVSDLNAERVKDSDAGSKIELALTTVQQTAAQNRMKLHIRSCQQQLCVELQQNTLFSPVCLRRIQ